MPKLPAESIDLSAEELERALLMRPKVPLTASEVETLREVIQWFDSGKRERSQKALARERRAKRYPIIFGAISTLLGVGTFAYNVWKWLH